MYNFSYKNKKKEKDIYYIYIKTSILFPMHFFIKVPKIYIWMDLYTCKYKKRSIENTFMKKRFLVLSKPMFILIKEIDQSTLVLTEVRKIQY